MGKTAFQKGDIIKSFRGLYWHFGVYVGDSKVIHFSSGTSNEMNPLTADIICSSLEEFTKGDHTIVDLKERSAFTKEEIVSRAKKMLGSQLGSYDPFTNNCEHFANWCKNGRAVSHQSEVIAKTNTLLGIIYETRRKQTERCYNKAEKNPSIFCLISDILADE